MVCGGVVWGGVVWGGVVVVVVKTNNLVKSDSHQIVLGCFGVVLGLSYGLENRDQVKGGGVD